ncbi:MAG: S1 RNA-binding domain-containing protein [Candidatus Levybacteria bacterium]|nr:S1 RNA-binding domain-containing protein [Candidatus Levybacteria bacterium]
MSKSAPKTSSNSGQAQSMAELMARSSSHFNTFKKGQEVEGTVKKLTSKEILLDIGAKSDALVLEVDKSNMDNLMAILKVGDKVKCVILSPEAEEGFPVVSLRRALDNIIYAGLDKSVKANETVEVSVGDLTRGGYFVVDANGIKGFLPNSQVLTDENLTGQTIKVKIIESDRAKKRVIFSQKATEYITDTETLKKILPKGTKVKATVVNPASYGIFVTIPGEDKKLIEGFVHISEVSYERVENLSNMFKKGDTLEVSILDVDSENRRVNASLKALLSDSFKETSEKFKKEDKVKGTIKDVKTRGVSVELEGGVLGFIPSDKIPAEVTYKVGDSVSAEVSDIDTKRRVIVLSPIATKAFVGYR